MPELPEVETIVRQLRKKIVGTRIEHIAITDPSIAGKRKFQRIKGETIVSVKRRAKYILLSLSSQPHLMIHLGMTGRLLWSKKKPQNKRHIRAIITLAADSAHISDSDLTYLVFHDVRKFGSIALVNEPLPLSHLGPEPLGREFTPAYLAQTVSKTTRSLKDLLLDQRKIAGIGNIYAMEILFGARLDPQRVSSSLTKDEIIRLHKETKRILRLAIKNQGTTFSDYVDSMKRKGKFQHLLAVYGKEDAPCPVCNTLIQRIRQSGRSTFFCARCQK